MAGGVAGTGGAPDHRQLSRCQLAVAVLTMIAVVSCGAGQERAPSTTEAPPSTTDTDRTVTTSPAPTSQASTTSATTATVPPFTRSTATSPPTAATHPADSGLLHRADARRLVGRLTVADPTPTRPAYDRDQWDEGRDADGDCRRTRHEVLARESVIAASLDDCHVVGGRWVDPLTGRTFTDPTNLQVDHLVALADAARSGGWRWNAGRKATYANDLAHAETLNAIEGGENQRKSDRGPESYRPPDPRAWCWYGVAYARVKVVWHLTVTEAQHDGLATLVAHCPAD